MLQRLRGGRNIRVEVQKMVLVSGICMITKLGNMGEVLVKCTCSVWEDISKSHHDLLSAIHRMCVRGRWKELCLSFVLSPWWGGGDSDCCGHKNGQILQET